jgi:hypothetical protein
MVVWLWINDRIDFSRTGNQEGKNDERKDCFHVNLLLTNPNSSRQDKTVFTNHAAFFALTDDMLEKIWETQKGGR